MPDFEEGSLPFELETLIDQHGLFEVLVSTALLCSDKAEHIRVNWQDRELARRWDFMSKKLGKLARQASEKGL